MTAVPGPVERCGYTITPEPGRYATFNPLTHNVRISKDGAHAMFPARLWSSLADVDDDIVQGILASLFYMPDDWEPPSPPLPTGFEMLAGQYKRLPEFLAAARPVQPSETVIPAGEPLRAVKLSAYVSVPTELLGEAASMFRTPTPEETAEAEVRHAAYLARKRAEHAAAVAEWEALREQHADCPAILAVLDIHQPTDRMECAHLTFGYEADAEEWPCDTYTAIKGATT